MQRALTVLAISFIAASAAAQEHEHGGASLERLGAVRFTNSCTAPAQPPFSRAMALLHSFEFRRAIEGFEATLKADPACAIALWGIAISH